MGDLLRKQVAEALYEALIQVCGGEKDSELDSLLLETSRNGVSVAKKDQLSEADGKPHDIEIRSALSVFHQLKHRQRKRKRVTSDDHAMKKTNFANVVLKSDLGLERSVVSPVALASLICRPLEEICRKQQLSYDIRPAGSSGLINMVTPQRAARLRAAGRLPCPFCTKWCKGEKGLWWHQQREHKSEHSVAVASAASERTVLALVPYGSDDPFSAAMTGASGSSHGNFPHSSGNDDLFRWAREGEIELLKEYTAVNGKRSIATLLDRKGASALHWAAGAGHLHLVQFLICKCDMDPNQPQRGKRGFSGRTSLHWSARNGHVNVVKYLLSECQEEIRIDASTADGTTAFGWAAWQAHLPILELLREHGCNVHTTNSFGCNAVLWVAQSDSEEMSQLRTLEWLSGIGCNAYLINSNGHGALHKAAQRGRVKIIEWFVSQQPGSADVTFDWIGPDSDGCCPSDLAGMAGHTDLAVEVACFERRLLRDRMKRHPKLEMPQWLLHPSTQDWRSTTVLQAWAPCMGIARLRRELEAIRDS